MLHELKVIAVTYTHTCNLSCVHCGRDESAAKKGVEQPASFFLDAFSQAKELGACQVNITGGEIFCRPDILELIAGAYDLGYFVTLESNGTLITDEHMKALAAMGDRVRLSISLDGFTAPVHDAIRGAGQFSKTRTTINQVCAYKIPARIITLLHDGNAAQIPEMVRHFVDKLGMGFRLLPFILEYGKGVYACNTHGMHYAKMQETLKFYFDFLQKKSNPEKLSVGLNMALVPVEVENHHLCPWGNAMIGIGPDGTTGLCHVSYVHPEFQFGNLQNESLKDIWEKNETLDRFRAINPDELHGICGNCAAREVCRGSCRLHAFTKYPRDFLAPDPQCQAVYDLGMFPPYAMEDENRDCSYEKGGR